MNYTTILFSTHAGVAKLVFNKPERLNSFDSSMHNEVRSALDQVKTDKSIRCLLITGEGRGFCAGQNLHSDEIKALDHNANSTLSDTLEKHYNPLILTLTTLDIPVICAVNGVAAGAGANIALACDIVLAARSASFIQAFCNIGLIPDAGGTWMLPRLIGHARAMAICLLGEKVTAEQAESWGMIWRCIDDENLQSEAENMAHHLASQPTKALAYTKQALHASSHNNLAEQLNLERDLQQLSGQTDDCREGITAFIQKRKPQFTGK